MSRARISRLKLTGSGQNKARISRLKITGTGTYHARVSRLNLTGSTSVKKARISRLKLTGTIAQRRARVSRLNITGTTLATLVANAGGGQVVEPLQVVVLDFSGTTGFPDTYVATQVSNGAPTVTLVGSGTTWGFTAPASAIGADVIIRLTVTKGASTDTDDATVSVKPQISWILNSSSQWTPEQIYAIS